jgi:superfamily II DNA or RNA helicase
MSELRDYQQRAVNETRAHWASGTRSVCLVAPTGAGKTVMGEDLIAGAEPVVWVAHRRELVTQTAKRLARRFGSSAVGTILPGDEARPHARVQVATVQTLLARGMAPEATRIVLDEAHHYEADDWAALVAAYPQATVLGLTATPQRADGRALGDTFEALVISAKYSELIAAGHLVPARVHRPDAYLGNDLAQDPIEAWLALSEGSLTFMFCPLVDMANAWAQRFRDTGVNAQVIECNTPRTERSEHLASFAAGRVRVIVNVNTMTEGVDVPEARTIVLARAFGHVGGYLQAVGRALRPAPNKPDMILIDLVGASARHGLPTDDRKYSLEGRAISGAAPKHGGCGRADVTQEVKGLGLRMVARGALPPDEAPKGVEPVRVDDEARRSEYRRLVEVARMHRMRDGFASVKYREKFGEWPRREWT